MRDADIDKIDSMLTETPAFVVSELALADNLRILQGVIDRTDCRILLAQKAFSMFSLYSMIAKTLHGVCASGLWEARLGRDTFTGEVHTLSAAYSAKDFPKIVGYSDHIIFNSINQLRQFRDEVLSSSRSIGIGLRINPEHSEGTVAIYDPCAPESRLGVTADLLATLSNDELSQLDGLHFHTLCEQDVQALERTLVAVEDKFGNYLKGLKWINFGGGHHITRPGYDVDKLCQLINHFKTKYDLQVYLEPGEAVVLNSGVLVASVLDIVTNQVDIAILDTSVPTHMPDVLEMPYRPEIFTAAVAEEKRYSYKIAGSSCLAGDVVGDYSFDQPLKVGDRLFFQDMAHYTMVKTNTFNGVKLPSIYSYDGELKLVKEFDYTEFKSRLS